MIRRYLTIFVTVFFILVLAQGVYARPSYQVQLKPLQSCLSCHVNKGGGGSLNKFGQAWVENGRQFKNIKDQDTDGDGFSNEEEIKKMTLPGDPNSNPDANSISPLIIGAGILVVIAIIAWQFLFKKKEKKDS